MRRTPISRRDLLVCAALAAGTMTTSAFGYVGPGAGFALVSGFLVIFTTIVLAGLSLLIWPFRMAWRFLRRRPAGKPLIRRFIVVGLDGQDPRITDRLMAEGKLPNFQRLAEQGSYRRLQTVYPSLSPVAWSSFGTGTNPGGHNVFDFVDRDPRNYMPRQASVEVGKLEKTMKVGPFKIPLHKPTLRLLRKSKPFWTILGEHNIWSTVLRVPITFPPDKFYGAQLSAMMVPDLLGTLGTFLHYTSRADHAGIKEGGQTFLLERSGEAWVGTLTGPENSFREGDPAMTLPLRIEMGPAAGRATVTLGKDSIELQPGKISDWFTLTFQPMPGIKVQGITRLQLLETGEDVSLYLSPINLDGEKPAMPISHPSYYSTYLSKKVGKFATLGLAEDTEALKEGVTDDATFLQQAYDIDRERQDMFFAALDRLHKGSLVCVFDGTDRIQHMFWRYTEEGHPADTAAPDAPHRDAIDKLYIHNDELVGKVLDKMRDGDVLCVLSDHGFTSFRRGVNVNGWLRENGYLALKDGADGTGDWLSDVDWSRTRAYFQGLSGVYLNLKGREAQGIVAPGAEAQALKAELIEKLSGLADTEKNEVGIVELFDTAQIYSGPYTANAPDFIVGFNEGYRTSWDCANGIVAGAVFEDNTKAWSGDHGIDPRLVPGIFFCNRKVESEAPSILDLAPTVLTLFGLTPPPHMEGEALLKADSFSEAA